MRMRTLLTAAALSALAVSTAAAGPHKDHKDKAKPAEMSQPVPMDAGDQGRDASSSEMYGEPVVLPADSTPPEEAWRLRPGDPQVTSNPPVPDTAQNRSRFGGPDSNGGRATRPVGN